MVCGPAEPAQGKWGRQGPSPDECAAPEGPPSRSEAITGTAPAHSRSKTEPRSWVVHNGETELQSVSSGRDLNTPTSRRMRRVLLPRTVDAPARGLDHKSAAAVVVCRPAVTALPLSCRSASASGRSRTCDRPLNRREPDRRRPAAALRGVSRSWDAVGCAESNRTAEAVLPNR